MSIAVTQRSLVNSSWADLREFSTNQCNQNQVKDIFGVSFRLIVLFAFFLIFAFELHWVTFPLFPNLPCNQTTKFGSVNLSTFWGVFWQRVHEQSHLTYFWSFSLFESALWFFLKSFFWVRAINMKMIVVLFLMLVSVSPGGLFKWSLAHFRAWFANHFTHNEI